MTESLAIDLQELTFSYGGSDVLRGVTLTLERGQTLGFVGPNGAGKTTSFNVIAGYLREKSGQVKVLGGSPRDIARVKGKLSILPQDAQMIANIGILPQLVFFAELLGYDGKDAEAEAMRVLEMVGLAEDVRKHPGHLSHGMAKRAGLAQAFLGKPELVLLDEPTAGLDPFAAKQIRDLVASMRGETTLVVSSHNLAEIQDLCSMIALIHQGRIIKQDSIEVFTQKENQLRIQVRGGHPPMGFFQKVEQSPGVRNVFFDQYVGWMTINLLPDAPPAEEVIKLVVGEIFALNLSIGEIQRGTSLEDVFMSLTGGPSGPQYGGGSGPAR
ncbi:MAG: ABC transporter ATP-binding protein [Polyangia bacterium]|nr:ABC transporter ATP-binding protein [Polyangia bacterium]